MKKLPVLISATVFALAFAGCAPASEPSDPTVTDDTITEETMTEDSMMETTIPTEQPSLTIPGVEQPTMEEESMAMTAGEVQAFAVTGTNFTFDVKEIRVKEGDTVRITYTNGGGMHDFVLDEFGLNTGVLEDGESMVLEFTATQKGEFEYYCSVNQHRAMGMTGKLIVE